MTEVDIAEVTTGDGDPTVSPFRISSKPSKDSFGFTLSVSAGSTIRALRVRFEPLSRNLGRLLYSRGMVCGSGDVCGSPDARSLFLEPPYTTSPITIDKSQLGGEADGEYDVQAWAMADEGWSS